MNPSELTLLQQDLSNDARALYCLGLRPGANSKDGLTSPLNYKQLLAMLNSKEEKFSLGRHINGLIKELVKIGLVELPDETSINRSFNGKQLILPCLVTASDQYTSLHLSWHNMTLDWQPDLNLFGDLGQLVGIIDKAFTTNELGEFVAYWMGRPQMQFSQYQWTQKFVFHIKQKRLASGVKVLQKVGNQLVEPKANLEVDENARKLVEKYSNKQ